MRLPLASTAFLFGLASVCFALDAQAYCQATTCGDLPEGCSWDSETGCEMNGTGVSWRRGCVSYAIQADGSPLRELGAEDLEEALEEAALTWISADCAGEAPQVSLNSLGTAACGAAEYNPSGQNMNLWVFRDSGWPYGTADMSAGSIDASAIAYATLTYEVDSGELLDVDVEINSEGIPITKEVTADSFDLRSIVTHEMGHFLGLDHSLQDEAVMAEKAIPGAPRHELAPDDAAGVCALYDDAPLGSGSCSPEGGFSEECGADQEPAPKEKSGCQWSGAARSATGETWPWLGLILAATYVRRKRSRSPSPFSGRAAPT